MMKAIPNKISRLRLDAIRFDAGTQTRAHVDDATVVEYAEAMLRGDRFSRQSSRSRTTVTSSWPMDSTGLRPPAGQDSSRSLLRSNKVPEQCAFFRLGGHIRCL